MFHCLPLKNDGITIIGSLGVVHVEATPTKFSKIVSDVCSFVCVPVHNS